jgi:hypothetical protein
MSFLRFFLNNKRYIGTLVTFTVLLLFNNYVASSQAPTEQQVKAVYIYNFINFVEWPRNAFKESADSFVIGIAGLETYSTAVGELVKGETYKGSPISTFGISFPAS